MTEKSVIKFDYITALLFIPAAYISYLFHEFGHWIIGVLQGYEMKYSLNGVWPDSGQNISQSHRLIGVIGGPAFTILQALVFVILLHHKQRRFFYPFVLFPFVSRVFSLVLGEFHLQDEAKIAFFLGTWDYLVAAVVLLVLLALVWRANKILKLKTIEIWNFSFFAILSKLLIIMHWEIFHK